MIAENLDLVMSIYNLGNYSSNYFEATRSLWFYSKYKVANINAAIANKTNLNHLKIGLNH